MAYQREVRIGLVLYGGVSLAVYENGIAQEVFRAVRGQGFYQLIRELIGSDIVVDIISGTSAGGVNGVMLAYALANKKQFAASANLWREQGDIEKLMRSERDTNPSSVLDSKYYQEKLKDCFAGNLQDDHDAEEIGEMDLFVTSTDANGALSTVYDDLGHAIDIKNHRALFKLAYRGARKNDLGAGAEDLAKLCRMTSCFPVAFEPVEIGAADQSFISWGKLRGPAVFLDGGILNNKPFTSTIEAIASRTATRDVERFLIYVEPDPERFKPPSGPPPSPPMLQAATHSLISIPGYQSIAADLDAIQEHNQRAGTISEILHALPAAQQTTAECLHKVSVTLDKDDACDASVYYKARYVQIRDAAVAAVIDDAHGRGYFPVKAAASQEAINAGQNARRSGRILVQSFDAWPGDGHETLEQYDVFFRVRRIRHLTGTLMRSVKNTVPTPTVLWESVNHYFKLYEIVQWAMVRRLQTHEFPWRELSAQNRDLDTKSEAEQKQVLEKIAIEVWGQVAQQIQHLLSCDVEVPAVVSASTRQTFYDQLGSVAGGADPESIGTANLLDTLDNGLKQVLLDFAASNEPETRMICNTLRNEFCRFLDVDRQLFLVQMGSEFESTDMIRVVRFSPLDAQRCLSRGSVENKVRGSTVAAFGGFFKKSWRASDIMVGRLDGACLLVECLLTRERLASLFAPGNPARTVSQGMVQASFRNMTATNALALTDQINDYLANPTGAVDDRWNALVDAIVGAAQHEIHLEEFPNVVACALAQEYDWGRFRFTKVPPSAVPDGIYNRPQLFWYRAKNRIDEVLVQVAAEYIAKGRKPPFVVAPFAPGSVQARPFMEEIPDSVLQELGALAAIRVGKGLLGSVSDDTRRRTVAKNLFYKLPFGVVAPIFYRLARIRRTQPDTVIILNTTLVAFCLTLIGVAIALPHVGIKADGAHRIALLAAGVVPLAVWAALLLLLRPTRSDLARSHQAIKH